MAVNIPGLSLSILRQQTSVRSGLPLLISGRFTAFGLGVPAYIRVFLEGPTYDPQLRSFDTFASPFSGDYTVNVIAEKDGHYNVYAQAFPPPIVPTGPPFPDALLLLPPMSESTRPPLVVGIPFDGGVEALLPDGTSQRLTAPPMQPIEFRPLITVGAPGISISIPGAAAAPVAGIPWFPALPGAPPAPAPPVAPALARAVIDDVQFIPPAINPGQEATGVMTWRNTGDAPTLFDTVFYLIATTGERYGPLQVNQEVSAHPQVPNTQNVRLGTQGIPSGFYAVVAEVYDSATGAMVAARTLAGRLEIREIVAPPIPVPPVPPPPVVPVPPTPPDILGTPSLYLPNQLTVGDTWSGSVSLPTFGDVPFFGEARLLLLDPTGAEQIVAQGGRTIQPGEILQIPVNFDTTGFAAGDYTILLQVFDQMGNQIAEFPMGFLSMLAAALPPIPEIPTPPTAPTADMFGTPSINLPSEVEIGGIWQGSVNIPTYAPPALMALPSLPSLPVDIGLQLQSPTGQMFDVGTYRPTFTPGQPIDLPMNFATSVLPQEGIYNLVMNIQDLQGNTLFSNVIGALRALMPAVPPIPPVPPELSEFPSIAVNLGPSQAEVDGTLSIPITYTHLGAPETVILYAAIGNDRPPYLGGFDEVWHAQKTISVPLDAAPIPRSDRIDIPITPKLRVAGVYSVYAKIMGRGLPFRDVISPTLPNIVEVLAPPGPPAPPLPPTISRADIADIDFRMLNTGELDPGATVAWIMNGVYKGRAQGGSLTIAFGKGSFAPLISLVTLPSIPVNFEESQDWAPFSFSGNFTLPAALELGATYSVKARLETFTDPTQETDHDFNVIKIAAPPSAPPLPPAPPTADIANFNFFITASGPFDPGTTISWQAGGVYKGRAQPGSITVALGTGVVGTFFPKFTVPSIPVNFEESQDWTPFSFSGSFTIPSGVERGQTYSTRATIATLVQATQEIDTDYGAITITAPPAAPPPVTAPSEFSNVSVAYPTASVRIDGSVSLRVSFVHSGQGESEWLYAAIGNDGVFGFDEILSNRRAITVPDEAQPTFHSEIINIPVTTTMRPGTYDVYAKIGVGVRPKAISSTTHDVIRVTS